MNRRDYEEQQAAKLAVLDRLLRKMLGTDPRNTRALKKAECEYEAAEREYDKWMEEVR